jgi:hypothetical protein
MTVETYLRAKIPGYPFTADVINAAAFSPLFAKPTAFEALDPNAEINDIARDEELTRSLKYAISTLYYAVAGVFSGGTTSEQVGDVKVSVSGFEVTQSDRDYYRSLADSLRGELNCEQESNPTEDDGMFDATYLTLR